MKTPVICLSFLLCLGSLALTSEDEELRQINLGQLGPSLLSLLTAAAAGAGTASLVGLLSGGKGKDGLFGKHGKDGIFGKHGIFGKDGIFGKHGKGKKRSLMSVEERQDLNTLLSLLPLLGGADTSGLAGLLQLPSALSGAQGAGTGLASLISGSEISSLIGGGKGKNGKDGKGKDLKAKNGKGKDGKGKEGKGKGGKGKDAGIGGNILSNLLGGKGVKGGKNVFSGLFGRSLKLVESERHGKGKDGKGKDGKGKGKDSVGSSLLDTLSNNLLGQIIQAALNLLTGALGRSDVAMEPRIDLSSVAPLPNPLTNPLGFITNPMISAIITAMVGGDIAGMLKAQGDLAGYLITQFITNAITG